MTNTISPQQLQTQLQQNQNLDLIDVRTPAEYRTAHVVGTRLIPLDKLSPDAVKNSRPPNAAGPTYILCKSGNRAAKAAQQLAQHNIQSIVVEGGTDACINANLPIQRGKQTISLERQVRIAAGLLVLLGSILAATLSPWFILLPAFVGAGLAFAGLTNTCAMARLLTKAPWNR